MRATAVYRCISILSGSVTQIPVPLYRRGSGSRRERATDHPLYKLTNFAANRNWSSERFKGQMMSHLAARGNAYAWIERNRADEVIGLWPLHPSAVEAKLGKNGAITYKVREENGETIEYQRDRIMHIRGLSEDGITGLSPVQLFREPIGLSLAAERSGAQFFGNGARPGIVFETTKQVKPEDKARFIAEWTSEYSRGGQGRPAILDQEMKLHDFSISQQDAQYLETRQFQTEEIARIFGVPPTMIGANDKQTSWGTGVEAQQIGYLVTTLAPILSSWAAEMNMALLTADEQDQYFFEFLPEAIVRADIKAKNEALAIQRDHGIINANEWRAMTNMNPIDGLAGEMYWRPANFIPADSPAPDPNANKIPVKTSADGFDVPIQILNPRGALNGNGYHHD